MGDLVTEAVTGVLYFADRPAFERVEKANASAFDKAALFANLARLNTLYMIANAGSGHIGSSFSSLDIVSWIYLNELGPDDIYFSSKGHDAPGLYAVLTAVGKLPMDSIHLLRRLDGLPGHPDVHTPGMVTNTGSLGMGVSKAKGMAYARRREGRPSRFFVMTGDGELQEGQIWESLISAANVGYNEITVIVDHNKIQSDYSVERTSSLGDLSAKFAAFGWHVQEIDGHDLIAIERALRNAEKDTRPSVVIANTVKGRGVSFMEGVAIDSDVERFQFHSGAPKADDYTRAVQELLSLINDGAERIGIVSPELESVRRSAGAAAPETVRLFPAYTEALLDAARKDKTIVALDADLVLDMGLEPFRAAFPDRFVECGIAEMDMVSQAGGMALMGLTPIVHSFSCFLATRPNEQIYNNATEHTKIVYVGGLSGVLPAGPGHSHQSVRDISCVGSIPGLAMVEPSHPDEVGPLFRWCTETHDRSSYLRLVSIPFEARHQPPKDWRPISGRGYRLRDGADAAIFAHGLVGVSQAMAAAERLSQTGFQARVVNLPFLNFVDTAWLVDEVQGVKLIATVENHYIRFGQGDVIASSLASAGALKEKGFTQIGLLDVPPSGANDEVLAKVSLSAESIAERVKRALA